jgi:hypothetical protein
LPGEKRVRKVREKVGLFMRIKGPNERSENNRGERGGRVSLVR